jgi:hypothetical protein
MCMYKSSHVFNNAPFFSMLSISIVLSSVSYVCCVFSMCCANLEFGLLVLIA